MSKMKRAVIAILIIAVAAVLLLTACAPPTDVFEIESPVGGSCDEFDENYYLCSLNRREDNVACYFMYGYPDSLSCVYLGGR